MEKIITIDREQVPQWFQLAVETLWGQPIRARYPAVVTSSDITLNAVARSDAGNHVDVVLSVVLSEKEQTLQIEAKEHDPPSPTSPILEDRKRLTQLGIFATAGFGPSTDRPSDAEIEHLLESILERFLTAAKSVINGRQFEFVVGIIFEGDVNWPLGRFSVGDCVGGRISRKSGYPPPAVLLARSVEAFSPDEAGAVWQRRLNVTAAMLGIFSGREIKLLASGVLARIKPELDFAFYPLIEDPEGSQMLAFLEGLPVVETRSFYSDISSSELDVLPDDLGDMMAGFGQLEGSKRTLLSNALLTYQTALENREQQPTISLVSFWSVLEGLLGYYGISRTTVKECGCTQGRSREAIMELIEKTAGPLEQASRDDVQGVLRLVGKFVRNPWLHEGQLAGTEFSDPPEVWISEKQGEVPVWAQVGYLLREIEDFARRALLSSLEGLAHPG